MEDSLFQQRADQAMTALFKALSDAAERFEFEPDFNAGALSVEFEEPAEKYVVSPNSPVRQIWVSAQSRSFKLDWDEGREAFVLGATGQTLRGLMGELISKRMGETVSLG